MQKTKPNDQEVANCNSPVFQNAEGVRFWVEPEFGVYLVVCQAPGGPATAAYDDLFAFLEDAVEAAQLLSEGKL